ncbi:hypothetical protein G6F36_010665 [Rhizopus arrhizus]|nr:hypothetical protein G6F36_010665 [Rhizopus arrhizus]
MLVACKKCDDGRPCNRCIKLGLTATCRDSDRKERKKGVKRGPYKKRQVYNKDQPVYPKLTEELMVPSQIQFPDLMGYTQPISPANSFTSSSSDETLHFAYGYTDNYYPTIGEDNYWETTQLEKLLSMPIEQHYELNLLEGPSYWYPVHSSPIQQPSFIDYNIPLQFNQWS